MTRFCFLLVVLLFSLTSCEERKPQLDSKFSNIYIEGWSSNLERGITDTLYLDSFMPNAEYLLTFVKRSGLPCLSPRFEFYPIDLRNYVDKKLYKYLMLRSNLFPPAPKIFKTKEHYVVAWNLEEYKELKCCECLELESNVKEQLGMKFLENKKKFHF